MDEPRISVDIPGVKLKDVNVQVDNHDSGSSVLKFEAERKRPGQQSLTFSREWSLDPSVLDTVNTQASLVDGVLNIAIPRKEPTKRVIKIEGVEAPEVASSDTEKVFSVNLDLPGMNAKNVEALYKQGAISIKGTRKSGNSSSSVQRLFSVDEGTIDLDSLKGFLVDGVLTLRANLKEAKAGSTITIPVTSEPFLEETPKKKLKTIEDSKTKDGDVPKVDTKEKASQN